MSDEKFGIENLKTVITFGVTIGKTLQADFADKKLTFVEVISLAAPLMQIPDLLAKKDIIINEAKDLSRNEIEELVGALNGTVTSENLVATLEDALNIIVSVKNLIERYK